MKKSVAVGLIVVILACGGAWFRLDQRRTERRTEATALVNAFLKAPLYQERVKMMLVGYGIRQGWPNDTLYQCTSERVEWNLLHTTTYADVTCRSGTNNIRLSVTFVGSEAKSATVTGEKGQISATVGANDITRTMVWHEIPEDAKGPTFDLHGKKVALETTAEADLERDRSRINQFDTLIDRINVGTVPARWAVVLYKAEPGGKVYRAVRFTEATVFTDTMWPRKDRIEENALCFEVDFESSAVTERIMLKRGASGP